jgi:hypothetical protein
MIFFLNLERREQNKKMKEMKTSKLLCKLGAQKSNFKLTCMHDHKRHVIICMIAMFVDDCDDNAIMRTTM